MELVPVRLRPLVIPVGLASAFMVTYNSYIRQQKRIEQGEVEPPTDTFLSLSLRSLSERMRGHPGTPTNEGRSTSTDVQPKEQPPDKNASELQL